MTRGPSSQAETRAGIDDLGSLPCGRPSGTSFKDWGALQGTIVLPQAVLEAATQLAAEHYAQAEAEQFCGESVTDFVFPDWMAERHGFLPLDALRALGFGPLGTGEMLLATVSVGSHADNIHGPCLVIVLHNDGLRFKQGRNAHRTLAGQWYVFDDRRLHEVIEGKCTTSYLLWSVPVRRL